jgi:mannose-1-phosphate guanylyltransferase
MGERTLFQMAVDRLAPLFALEQVFVVTRSEYVAPLAEQMPGLPRENFIVEPEGRGTAPAIGLAAVHLRRRDPEAIMAVLTADHAITDAVEFRRILKAAQGLAQAGQLVTLGIKPATSSTGYGYIHHGESSARVDGLPVFQVERFVEKPNLATATQMLASGEYSWNGGMFIWRVERILSELERQMPAFYAQLRQVEAALGQSDYSSTLQHVWPRVAEQTIDYGVMEGAHNVAVIPTDIGWSDVGSWSSLLEVLPSDEAGNVFAGPHIALDTRHTLVVSEKRLVATIGVEHLVIVETDDALLICSQEREQDVRTVVSQLKQEGRTQYI